LLSLPASVEEAVGATIVTVERAPSSPVVTLVDGLELVIEVTWGSEAEETDSGGEVDTTSPSELL
jgi:hypothetical protein